MAVNSTASTHPLVMKWNGEFISNTADDLNGQGQIEIYPNPAQDIVHYSLGDSLPALHTLTLTDVLGTMILQGETDTWELDLTHLPAGLYLLRIHNDSMEGIGKIIRY